MHKLAYLYLFPFFFYFWINSVFIKKILLASERDLQTYRGFQAAAQSRWVLPGWYQSAWASEEGSRGDWPPEGSAGAPASCSALPSPRSPRTVKLLHGENIIITFFTHRTALHSLPSETLWLIGKPPSAEISCCLFLLPFQEFTWRQAFLWWKGGGFILFFKKAGMQQRCAQQAAGAPILHT